MKEIKSPCVIAIGSVSGGGKTTAVTQLLAKLPNSKALLFDDYEFAGPDDVLEWLDRGTDYEEWNLTPLLKDLEKLRSEPLDYILLDYPFAYQHSLISKFIDFAVFIDTPLDIALTRRMTRDFKSSSTEEILLQMEHYATHGRKAYLEMLKTIKPNSDLIVDGALSTTNITNLIIENIGTARDLPQ